MDNDDFYTPAFTWAANAKASWDDLMAPNFGMDLTLAQIQESPLSSVSWSTKSLECPEDNVSWWQEKIENTGRQKQ